MDGLNPISFYFIILQLRGQKGDPDYTLGVDGLLQQSESMV
jgi:hypothetical protein